MINSMTKKPEILAPCGSYDILIAAIKAGADACYFGGNKFGARAYATNFDTDSVIKAIRYAHIHGVKLYLTVNTLFKDDEIKELYDYILPFYEAGLDAVIVQDLGVFSFIKQAFLDLPVHCSTQMNITSVHGAAFMRKQGAARIVTAREMSIDEIRHIKDSVDIEIESFVHGAMCYSYSGRCLMSSLAGGRSGNRGRCAQPCRKAYDGEYILSMKDMCTLTNLPAIVDAGVDSLKIEGRMKNEYYVASAVEAYSEVLNDCLNDEFDINKAERLQFKLANIFNRGGFCNGYYNISKGPEMISRDRPNNQGIVIGKVIAARNGEINLKLYEDLYRQDVIELCLRDNSVIEITSGISAKKGNSVWLKAPKSRLISVGKKALRTRCNYILESVEGIIKGDNLKYMLTGEFTARVGQPLSLKLSRNINNKLVSVTVTGDIIQVSKKHPADEHSIIEKLCQLGQTDYSLTLASVMIDDNAFVPASAIKSIRRQAIALLEDEIVHEYERHTDHNFLTTEDRLSIYEEEQGVCNNADNTLAKARTGDKTDIRVGVSNIYQLKQALNKNISVIYLNRNLFDIALGKGLVNLAREKNIKLYIALPEIIKNDFDLREYLPNYNINGIYINNIDGFSSLVNILDGHFYDDVAKLVFSDDFEIVCGDSLYGYNLHARDFISRHLPKVTFELPKELNKDELKGLSSNNNELVIYEHQRVMLSAQCVIKNKYGCNHNCDTVKITDDKNNIFYCKAVCNECCNIIYNGKPLFIAKYLSDLTDNIRIKSFRINFTIEDEPTVNNILSIVDDISKGGINMDSKVYDIDSYTTGHFNRGVE